MSVQVSYKKQFVLAIMIILVFGIIVEAFAWNYDYAVPVCSVMKGKPYENYELAKQICDDALSLRKQYDENTDWLVLQPQQYTKTININKDGFRGPEITKEKPADSTRVFVVGASTVLGLRSTDDNTIPGYLQKLFDETSSYKKIQVINAGISAIESTQELLLIQNKILDYDPDVIIIYDGAADIYHPMGYEYGKVHNSTKPSWQVEFKNFHATYFPFYKTINMFYDIGIKADQRFSKISFDDSNLELKIQIWKQNWIEICELGNTEGFQTLMVLQPMLGAGNKKLTLTEQQLFNYWNHEVIIPQYLQFFDELDEIQNYCDNTPDLTDVFDKVEEDIWFDGAHVGYQGNEIIAKRLFELAEIVIKQA